MCTCAWTRLMKHDDTTNTSFTLMYYESGQKNHRLTKKELCHSNGSWHALNSTFPDINCTVSFQINTHWISYSGLWKVVPETFLERPGKQAKGVLFHQDNDPAHKSVVAMAVMHDCGFELVDNFPYSPNLSPSDYFLFPNMKKTLGWEAVSDQWWGHMCNWGLFEDQDETFYTKSKHCCTDRRSVWPLGETMLKNKPHLIKFDHCSIVSPWTFQPTLVCSHLIVMGMV